MENTQRIEGFLFGHYDSRGGATFVTGTDELAARLEYIECGMGFDAQMQDAAEWANSPGAAGFWNELHAARHDKEKCIRLLTDEDFLGKTVILSEEPIPAGIDLEWDIEEDQTMLWEPAGQSTRWVKERTLFYGRTPPIGWVATEYGEDACGVVFVG